jgi:hypothetical protein
MNIFPFVNHEITLILVILRGKKQVPGTFGTTLKSRLTTYPRGYGASFNLSSYVHYERIVQQVITYQ